MSPVSRSVAVALCLIAMLAACGPGPDAKVSGSIGAGPTCPLGHCPDRVEPGITVNFAGSSSEKHSTVSDAMGLYSISLAAGDYTVTVGSPPPQYFEIVGPPGTGSVGVMSTRIHVTPGETKHLNFRMFLAIA